MTLKLALVALMVPALLAGCGPAAPGSDRFATQVAEEILGTQAAVAGRSINPGNASQVVELARFASDPVIALAVSDSGESAVYATVSGIHVLDVATFEERRFIPTPGRLEALAVSSDGHYAAGGARYEVTLWDLRDEGEQWALDIESVVDQLGFAPDGRTVVVLGFNSELAGFQVPGGRRQFTIPELHDADSFGFHPQNGQIAVPQVLYGTDPYVTFYDPSSGLMTDEWGLGTPASDRIGSMDFSDDGRFLAVGWDDAPAEVWETGGGSPDRVTVLPPDSSDARQVQFIRGNALLAVVPWGGPFQLWDLESLTMAREAPAEFAVIAEPYDHALLGSRAGIQDFDLDSGTVERRIDIQVIEGLALATDGRSLALAYGDGTIEFWDRRGQAMQHTLESGMSGLRGVGFLMHGAYFYAFDSGGNFRVWETSSWGLLPLPAEAGAPQFTPDGELLISRGVDPASLLVWDVEPLTVRHTLTHAAAVEGFLLSPAGDMLAVRIQDGSIWLWDVPGGRFLRSIDDYLTWANLGRVFSQDGGLLCSQGDANTIKIWSVADASLMDSYQLPVPPIYVDASADFSTVWMETEVDSTSTVHIWHPGQEEATRVDGYLGPSSPDGRLFVVNTWQEIEDEQGSSFRQVIQIRQATDGEIVQTLVDPGWALDFSRDGSILFVQSDDCDGEDHCLAIDLYAVEDGRRMAELSGVDDSSVFQSENGDTLAVQTMSGTVHVWGLP